MKAVTAFAAVAFAHTTDERKETTDMRRRISLLLAAVLAGTTLMLLGPAQPASAVYACAGTGTATVLPGLLYPVLLGVGIPPASAPGKDHTIDVLIGGDTVAHGFTFRFILGACEHPPSLPQAPTPPQTAAGTLRGYCGHSAGVGTFAGDPFTYISVGGTLLITGHVVGAARVDPILGTGSCVHVATPAGQPTFALPGGATDFLVNGAIVGLNCTNALPATQTLQSVSQLVLPTQTVGAHVQLGVHFWTMGTCAPSLTGL